MLRPPFTSPFPSFIVARWLVTTCLFLTTSLVRSGIGMSGRAFPIQLRGVVLVGVISTVVFGSAGVSADTWANKHVTFKIDQDSFADNIVWLTSGMHLESNTMYAWWVGKALSAWAVKTGVNDGGFTSSANHVTFTYGGDTSVASCPQLGNATNEIAAVSGCELDGYGVPDCSIMGQRS